MERLQGGSEPGVGSGSDRGKLVPKSGMEDGEKSCVYFCGARTANRFQKTVPMSGLLSMKAMSEYQKRTL